MSPDYITAFYGIGLIVLLAFIAFAFGLACVALGDMAEALIDEFKRLTNWR